MARAVPARLTAAQGRRFAFAVGGAMLVLAGIAIWRGARVGQWILGPIGAALIIAGVAVPTRLGPVERAWMAFALAISKVTTPIVMGVLYFVVITPVGMVARLFGYNALTRARTPTSAWVRRAPGARRGDLERQF
jgi:saxitoxin biosynthesis operon SxtJ-like protein